MEVRYKKCKSITHSSTFNVGALGEVLTGDDSPFISELDVLIDGEWKDMRQAFTDRDIIPNNHNTSFGPPMDQACKERGYNP